jgi:VWFA-related protein
MPQPPRARRFLPACLLSVVALATAASPAAQTQGQPQGQGGTGSQAPPAGAETAPAPDPAGRPGQPTFRTEANFVLTDVFVTADGRPVTDLTQADFEVREDGTVQTIRSFEHVQLGGTAAGLPRRSPASVAESRAVAADPRRRVFALFLDTFHVSRAASMETRDAIKAFVSKVLGPDDLIGFVTPQMTGADISFSTTADSIVDYFETNPVWGLKDEPAGTESDPVERELSTCPGGFPRTRMREERSLKALHDLVRHLDGLRESRKAIITITEGWNLFTDDVGRVNDPGKGVRLPGVEAIGVGPDGRLGTPERYRTGGASQYACDTLRMQLAMADTRRLFMDLIGDANRTNASFYTIDAARLRAGLQRPVVTTPEAALAESRNRDRQPFAGPLDQIKTLATATNGLAVADTNDLAKGFQRVADDFNSFYLLGYNSTNTKQDGAYRTIKVSVKRPGVQVRAREGYRAARADEVSGPPAGSAPAAPVSGEQALVSQALGRLAPVRPGVPFVLYASAGLSAAGHVIRIVAELDPSVARGEGWVEGGTAQALVRDLRGETLASAQATLAPGARTVQLDLPVPPGMSGDVKVQVRLTGNGNLARHSDTTTVRVEQKEGDWGAPIVQRRGPTTGTSWIPTADLRFRRQERVRVSVGTRAADAAVPGTLLDRNGKPMDVPVRVNRAEPEALVAELSLAPLAAGDYVIAIGSGTSRLLVPFRVIP